MLFPQRQRAAFRLPFILWVAVGPEAHRRALRVAPFLSPYSSLPFSPSGSWDPKKPRSADHPAHVSDAHLALLQSSDFSLYFKKSDFAQNVCRVLPD